MPGTTPVLGYPYPTTSDSPHGPSQIQALAQAVEDDILAYPTDLNLTSSAKVSWNGGDVQLSRRAAGQLTSPHTAVLTRPFVHAYQTSAQPLANITQTAINLQADLYDPLGWHSTAINLPRITPTIPGWYDCWAQVMFDVSTAGDRSAHFRFNGATLLGAPYSAAPALNGAAFLPGCAFAQATILCNGTTDYLEVWAQHNTGGSLNTFVSAGLTASTVKVEWKAHP